MLMLTNAITMKSPSKQKSFHEGFARVTANYEICSVLCYDVLGTIFVNNSVFFSRALYNPSIEQRRIESQFRQRTSVSLVRGQTRNQNEKIP